MEMEGRRARVGDRGSFGRHYLDLKAWRRSIAPPFFGRDPFVFVATEKTLNQARLLATFTSIFGLGILKLDLPGVGGQLFNSFRDLFRCVQNSDIDYLQPGVAK
jgi:hypothetical protein